MNEQNTKTNVILDTSLSQAVCDSLVDPEIPNRMIIFAE
jgi:hypothetical protein